MGIRIHNLYCDASGDSHWRDVQIDWAQEGPEGKTSARLPATGIIFRQTQAEHDRPWHPAPRRQYIINLDAGVELTASDGESRVIGAGEVDPGGGHHRTRPSVEIGQQPDAALDIRADRITGSEPMRIHNIYVDDAGETHWRDIEVQWVEERNGSKLSARLPATGIIFRETGGDYDLSWHPGAAPPVHHQPRRRRENHSQRRRSARNRRRRGHPGGGHSRQGPSVAVDRRQDAAFDLRADRVGHRARKKAGNDPGLHAVPVTSGLVAAADQRPPRLLAVLS